MSRAAQADCGTSHAGLFKKATNHSAFDPALEQGLDNLTRSQPATPAYPFSPFEGSDSKRKQCLMSDLPGRCGSLRNQTFPSPLISMN